MNMKTVISLAICLLAVLTGYWFINQTAPTPKKKIYFFSASWCPTCQEAVSAFQANPESLPSDHTFMKVDYDREVALKEKHQVTSPHTFIVLDEEDREVARFDGSDIKQKGWVVPSM